jgi:hypothetical protein
VLFTVVFVVSGVVLVRLLRGMFAASAVAEALSAAERNQ